MTHYEEAREAIARVASITSISSDDPDAAKKIADRLQGLRRNHDQMKLVNRYLRAKNDDGLKQIGFNETQIAKLKEPDMLGRVGFPDCMLKNNTANISRLEQRLKALSTIDKRERFK